MGERTVIVTGGNTGLGFECAKQLANGGWHVVIACRDAARGQQAADQLGGKAEVMLLDLASLASVQRFAANWGERSPAQALVCNAGIQVVSGLSHTEDGYETTFAVNHLGHFLLVELMRPHLAPDARVVVVASGTHDPAKATGMPEPRIGELEQLARPGAETEDAAMAGRRRYTTSKLCNVLFAYELARRAPGLRVAAFDPGMMPGSGLARDYAGWQQLVWNNVLPLLRFFQRNVHTTQESGRALARLVSDPTTTNGYYEGMREIRSSEASYDQDLAAQLWERSVAWVAG